MADMAMVVKQMLGKPIQVADQVSKAAEQAHTSKQECSELKSKTEKLASLLRQVARASSDMYERPAIRIIDDTDQVLHKALSLVSKCHSTGPLKRLFTFIPPTTFKKMASQLDNSIGDLSWLLRISTPAHEHEDEDEDGNDDDDRYLGGLPPIAANEPILCLIWEQIATLYTGSLNHRSEAAASLVSLARDNHRYGKLIMEESGVLPLLRLLKEGELEGQENAARAIGVLALDPESVHHLVHSGVCSVFAKILKDGPMKVQAVVAWAVSELASNYPKSQDHFAQNNVIRFLVGHLAFETVPEHNKYTVPSKKHSISSIHSVLVAAAKDPYQINKIHEEDKQISDGPNKIPRPMGNHNLKNMHDVVLSTMANMVPKSQSKPLPPQYHDASNSNSKHNNQNQHHMSGTNVRSSSSSRESEDPATKAMMKAMAARALWKLAKGNSLICKSITESRALLCFAVLLEKSTNDEMQYNSAMALMEIAAVSEKDAELRRSAFKPSSPAAKAVVDQLLKIIDKADSELLTPCIKAIGHLARIFRSTETKIIGPLVRLLDEREGEVSREAAIALSKFVCTENYLHIDHSSAIISAGGVKHLIQLVYFGEQIVQVSALILLCYIAIHVPDSEALAQAEVLTVLEWASKQVLMVQDPTVDSLLPEAKGKLELYQSRGSRGFQ